MTSNLVCHAVNPEVGNVSASLNVAWFAAFESTMGTEQTDRRTDGRTDETRNAASEECIIIV